MTATGTSARTGQDDLESAGRDEAHETTGDRDDGGRR